MKQVSVILSNFPSVNNLCDESHIAFFKTAPASPPDELQHGTEKVSMKGHARTLIEAS